MAANGNNGQSAASAQASAAAGNAAASNAANSNTSGTSSGATGNTSTGNTSTGNTSTGNTSSGATNSAGLMGSLIGFGNAVAKGEVGNNDGSGNKTYSEIDAENGWHEKHAVYQDRNLNIVANLLNIDGRNNLSPEMVAAGDRAYTKARAEGKTEAEAQYAARDVIRGMIPGAEHTFKGLNTMKGFLQSAGFKAKNTGPTYNPATTAQANTNPTIAAGSSKMGPSTTANNAPGNIGGETGGIAGSTETSGTETSAPSANNTGVTYRGGTVTNGGTSVTDSGTGGSISSGVNAPSRDASSIGLGVYNADRANYDQDNWNRGMEVESSSLVSDEECKAFAKRAFMENSEPFKKVRISIIKKC